MVSIPLHKNGIFLPGKHYWNIVTYIISALNRKGRMGLTGQIFHFSIIAVGYEARKFGVTRQMRGDDAKEKCPDVNIIYVQENRGKADLTVYREAGAEVIKVLSTFSDSLERASIDEAYIDLSSTINRCVKFSVFSYGFLKYHLWNFLHIYKGLVKTFFIKFNAIDCHITLHLPDCYFIFRIIIIFFGIFFLYIQI